MQSLRVVKIQQGVAKKRSPEYSGDGSGSSPSGLQMTPFPLLEAVFPQTGNIFIRAPKGDEFEASPTPNRPSFCNNSLSSDGSSRPLSALGAPQRDGRRDTFGFDVLVSQNGHVASSLSGTAGHVCVCMCVFPCVALLWWFDKRSQQDADLSADDDITAQR